MNSVQIKSFLAVVEHQSYTKAAEHIFVTQSALSKHIATIEREVGARLFLRDGNLTRLTEEGEIFSAWVEQARSLYFESLQRMGSLKKDEHSLSIGLLEGQLIDPMIRDVIVRIQNQTKHYGRCAYFTLERLIEALMSREVDLIITADSLIAPIPHELDLQLIRESGTRLLLSTSHPLAGQDGLALADFSGDVFITIDRERYPLLAQLQSWMSAKRGHPNMRITAPNFETMAMWVAANMGITIASAWDPMLANPALKALEIQELGLIREVAAWRKNNENPLIGVFLAELAANVGDVGSGAEGGAKA